MIRLYSHEVPREGFVYCEDFIKEGVGVAIDDKRFFYWVYGLSDNLSFICYEYAVLKEGLVQRTSLPSDSQLQLLCLVPKQT